MEADDLTWRWPAAQLDALAQIAQAGDFDRDATNSAEALAIRMRAALRAGQLVDDLVNRLMLALLDAGAPEIEVAELIGLASTSTVKRRVARELQRQRKLQVAKGPPRLASGTEGSSGGHLNVPL